MKKLFIHIGQHKTGSTSIQKTLVKKQKALNNQGFFIYSKGYNNQLRWNLNDWFTFDYSDSNEYLINTSRLKKLAIKLSKIQFNNIIISSEQLSWINNEDDLISFKKELIKYFDEIKVIVYIRRQDKQLISHFQQGSKKNDGPCTIILGSKPESIPNNNDFYNSNYLDYNKRLSIWGNLFGDNNMIIRVFEKDNLINNDVVDDFCNLLKIEINNKNSKKDNTSYGFEKTKVNHIINSCKLKNEEFIRFVINKNLDNSEKLLPSRIQAMDIYSKFKESNKKLNKRFKINDSEYIFDENFSMYSENSQDMWTEEKANNAIKNIIESLNNLTFYELIKFKFKHSKFKYFYKNLLNKPR